MKLIPLEEVKKYTIAWTSGDTFFNNKQVIVSGLDDIPTIDPFATIDEMIREIDRYLESPDWGENKTYTKDKYYGKIEALQELKSRLLLTQK